MAGTVAWNPIKAVILWEPVLAGRKITSRCIGRGDLASRCAQVIGETRCDIEPEAHHGQSFAVTHLRGRALAMPS